MRRFIGFLLERRDYVVLLFSVIFSLYFLFSGESPEIQILRGKANSFLAILHRPVLWVRGINELRAENDLLRQKATQLALLNSSLLKYKYENERLRLMLDYSRSSQLELKPARVVSQGISPLASSITIDVGSEVGIERNMAVMSVDGIVGKTISVGSRVSVVQIMSDYNFRASVKLEESGSSGILRRGNKGEFEVWEVPSMVVLRVGERVITSGYSDIFPEDLPVGKVVGHRDNPDKLERIILVRAFTDFARLEHVFVVQKVQP